MSKSVVLVTVSVALLIFGCGGTDDREDDVVDGGVQHEMSPEEEGNGEPEGIYIKDWEDGGTVKPK